MTARPVIIGLVVIVPVLYLLARPRSPDSEPKRAARLDVHEQSVADRERASQGWLREQIADEQRSRAKVNARLVELEARLSALQQHSQVAGGEPEATKPARNDVSEADVATWMDDELQGRVDAPATAQASREIHDSLTAARLPELRVENVSCSDRYCRASFFRDNGEPPAVRELFGAPPFTGEGFTIEEAGGRVAIYFARNGASVRDLRGEALAAAAP